MAKLADFFRKNKNDIIIPSVVLLCICIIIPLALAFTNRITKDKIAGLEEKNSRETMARLIKADEYTVHTAAAGQEKFTYHTAVKDGETVGYVFETAENGYGGSVSVMTAVNPDGTVKSVAILDVSGETPGLGQNAGKESFYTQFDGKKAGITLRKNSADSAQNEVQAVTGATITSTAVNKAVNRALDYFEIAAKEAADSEAK